MKFHSKVFGWEYTWQEFAQELQGKVELDEAATQSVKSISVPLGLLGEMKVFPNPQRQGTPAQTIAWVEFAPQSSFTVTIHTESWTDHIGKLFGMQDIEIGDERVDERFVIQSNDRLRTIELFQQADLRAILLSFPDMALRILQPNAKLPHGLHVTPNRHALCFKQEKLVHSYDELSDIHRLLKAVLSEIQVTSTASNYRPSFADRFVQRV